MSFSFHLNRLLSWHQEKHQRLLCDHLHKFLLCPENRICLIRWIRKRQQMRQAKLASLPLYPKHSQHEKQLKERAGITSKRTAAALDRKRRESHSQNKRNKAGRHIVRERERQCGNLQTLDIAKANPSPKSQLSAQREQQSPRFADSNFDKNSSCSY